MVKLEARFLTSETSHYQTKEKQKDLSRVLDPLPLILCRVFDFILKCAFVYFGSSTEESRKKGNVIKTAYLGLPA